MTHVDAIYQNGVFKPMQDVGLPENQRVRLGVQPVEVGDALAWPTRVQERRERITAKHGYCPDSTLDIAEDRRR